MEFISLEEAKKLKLDKRYCTKYVVDRKTCNKLVSFIENNFKIVKDQNNEILMPYHSLYFDTPDLQMNKDHVDHKLHRQKIRVREYYSGEKFLEIKDKNNHVTTKKRIPVNSYELDGETQWVSENLIYDTKDLDKKLDVFFYRITLINKQNPIRMTIDFNLRFFNYITNKPYNFGDTIIEIKRESLEKTFVENELESLGIQPQKFSKYNFGLEKTQEQQNEAIE